MASSSSNTAGATSTSVVANGAPANKTKSILKTDEKQPAQGAQFPAFRVDLRYRNTLPSVPFDPYFLDVPVPADFLWGFKQSTLEKNYKYRIHMNPPQLNDDMIDPLGAEEWAKAIEFDERDKALQRKDGVEVTAKANKHSGANREAKTWMLRTIYTRENVHRQSMEISSSGLPQVDASKIFIEEDEDARRDLIEQQFQVTNSGNIPANIPAGKTIKRVLPLLPSRQLREINLHLIRYKVGEKIVRDDVDNEKDDEWTVNKAILLHRNHQLDDEEAANPTKQYTPLSLFLPKKIETRPNSRDEEEDLFAEDEEASPEVNTTAKGTAYDTKHVEYVREYQVKTINAKNDNDRFALIFDEDAVRYVELEDISLRLFRIKQPGDDERIQQESNVEITVNLDVSEKEKKQRHKRRKTIEGGELDLD